MIEGPFPMSAIDSFEKIKAYITENGADGVTAELMALTEACGLVTTDISDGDMAGFKWNALFGEGVELTAISRDGAPFDFTLNRLSIVETEHFDFATNQDV